MTALQIKKVLIIGAGTMAQHIGVQCALFGHGAVMYVRNADELDGARRGIQSLVLRPIIEAGMATEAQARETTERISFIEDPAQTPADIDLVSESVLERVEIKRAVWSAFAPYLPQKAILTTNTSSLLPSSFAAACGDMSRFLAWHFAAPVFFQNLVDIMPIPETAPEYVPLMESFSKKIRQNSVVLHKEVEAYLHNNMLFSVLNTALGLYRTGAADAVAIDRSWMGVRMANSGPLGIVDKIGLDTMRDIFANWDGYDPQNNAVLDEMIAQGRLGVKSGRGFYSYPDPEYRREGFVFRAQPL